MKRKVWKNLKKNFKKDRKFKKIKVLKKIEKMIKKKVLEKFCKMLKE